MRKLLLAGIAVGVLSVMSTSALAHGDEENCNCFSSHSLRADDHGPIGVMGDNMHKAGEWMISARAMRMEMDGNRIGTHDVSDETIVTTETNLFAGVAGQPPTLRVVPNDMSTDMVMLGGMIAPTDTVTLIVMTNYLDRKMNHTTFQGGAGTTRLGTFTTKASGWGDTTVGALIRLYEDDVHHLHINSGLSLPTGSIDEEDDILTPMNMRPTMRLPYAMQLGSGTYDLLPGMTYSGKNNKFGWGAQYSGTIRLGENSEDYTWGDKHQLSIWGSYLITPAVSASVRVIGETEGKIDGIDSQIVAPVQTADPDNYGGRRISTAIGINTVVPNGILKGHRFSAEVTLPVYQNLNGPQMKHDSAVMIGWSKAF